MTSYFHSKGLGPEVLEYFRDDHDWLLTRRLPGLDCLDPIHLDNPKNSAIPLPGLCASCTKPTKPAAHLTQAPPL